jgi:hypothetical protein
VAANVAGWAVGGDRMTGPLPWICERGEGRLAVRLELRAHGRDLLLLVGGGSVHAGAVAVVSAAGGTAGEPCDELAVVPGHKEGPLAREGARLLAAASGRTCVAVAGIHQDRATPAEIAAIVSHARAALHALADAFARLPNGEGHP